jgi:hypothetical protein
LASAAGGQVEPPAGAADDGKEPTLPSITMPKEKKEKPKEDEPLALPGLTPVDEEKE